MFASNWLSLFLILSTTSLANAKKFKRSPILGGDVARPNQFPYAVAIISLEYGFICTGGIIGERHILSAAHCFAEEDNSFKIDKFFVFAGTTNYQLAFEDENSIAFLIKTIFIPSTFDYNTRKADISILELTEDLMLKKNNLQALTLPFNHRNIHVGDLAVAVGFGACGLNTSVDDTNKTSHSFFYDGKLRYANIEIVKQTKRHGVPYGHFQIGYYHLLGKMVKNSPETFGMCYGDSGSSLVSMSKIVIGVMIDAFDKECDGRTSPTIFTRVTIYLGFLRNAINGNITNSMRVNNITYDKSSGICCSH